MPKSTRTARRWTEFEVDMICHASRPSDAELARMLGRSPAAIGFKRFQLRNEGRDVPVTPSTRRPVGTFAA